MGQSALRSSRVSCLCPARGPTRDALGHETTDHLPDAFAFVYNNGDQIKNQREAPYLTSLLFLRLCNM